MSSIEILFAIITSVLLCSIPGVIALYMAVKSLDKQREMMEDHRRALERYVRGLVNLRQALNEIKEREFDFSGIDDKKEH